LDSDIIKSYAKSICEIRGYPTDMSDVNRSSLVQI